MCYHTNGILADQRVPISFVVLNGIGKENVEQRDDRHEKMEFLKNYVR